MSIVANSTRPISTEQAEIYQRIDKLKAELFAAEQEADACMLARDTVKTIEIKVSTAAGSLTKDFQNTYSAERFLSLLGKHQDMIPQARAPIDPRPFGERSNVTY